MSEAYLMLGIAFEEHSAFDDATWYRAYKLGYREPNYPVPAIKLFVLSDGEGFTIVPTTKVSELTGNWLINPLEGCTYY